jgi:hypothetical protein
MSEMRQDSQRGQFSGFLLDLITFVKKTASNDNPSPVSGSIPLFVNLVS